MLIETVNVKVIMKHKKINIPVVCSDMPLPIVCHCRLTSSASIIVSMLNFRTLETSCRAQ